MNTPSIYGLTLDQLEAWLLEQGQKKFRAQQIWDWLYIKRVLDFSEMTNLSKDLVALLSDHLPAAAPESSGRPRISGRHN